MLEGYIQNATGRRRIIFCSEQPEFQSPSAEGMAHPVTALTNKRLGVGLTPERGR